MIAFATLFLGLVLGVRPVEVLVAPEVTAVDLLLDGQPAARLEGPPWRAACDLGSTLVPRRLEAVAYGADGGELGRVGQWLNLPRRQAEAQLLLQPGTAGSGTVVRLSWDSVLGGEPTSAEITFDGRPLDVRDPGRFELPPHDPEQLHFLRAELVFPAGVTSAVEATFGGTYADRVQRELTGVPLALDGRHELPPAAEMAGWLARGGRALEVVAVDETSAEVLLVRDLGAQADLDALTAAGAGPQRASGAVLSAVSSRFVARLGRDQRLRLLTTFARDLQRPDYAARMFTSSDVFTAADGGLLWVLQNLRVRPPRGAVQRLADAVATAAVEAAAGARRRAVVLLLGDAPEDHSQLDAAAVRAYLQALRVPLLVWRTGPTEEPNAWGEEVDISSVPKLEAAAKELRRLLDRQRIVWVDGVHLPQEIALTERAQGVRLAT